MSLYLSDYQTSVVKQIHEFLPELKTCTTHPGKMTLEELKRVAMKSPAVHVAMMNVPGEGVPSQEKECDLTMVAYVTTRDLPRLPSETSSLNLVEALSGFIPGRQFFETAYRAEKTTARNLYSTKAGQTGVSLWGITWKQKVRLAKVGAEPLLKTLYIDDTSDRDTIVIDAASQARVERDDEFNHE